VNNVLDEESGGAVSVLKELVADPEIDKLNPIMVTARICFVMTILPKVCGDRK